MALYIHRHSLQKVVYGDYMILS